MNPIQLSLSVEEVNLILEALGQQPYAKVYQLIGKIQQQAETQIREADSHPAQPAAPGQEE